jgi:subfamily B ATP-binding cassette protein MsbA
VVLDAPALEDETGRNPRRVALEGHPQAHHTSDFSSITIMTNKEFFSRLYQTIRPYQTMMIVSMVSMVVVALLTGAQTYMLKPLVDDIFIAKSKHLLLPLAATLIVVFGVKGLFYYTYNFLLEQIGLLVIRDFRAAIFAHIHRQPLSFFSTYPTGTLISRIISDVNLMQHAVSTSLVGILRDLCTVVVMLGIVFYLNWQLALFCLLFFPIVGYPLVKFGKIFRRLSTSAQEQTAHLTNILFETITGNRIVKAFNMEEHENRRFDKQLSSLVDVTIADARFRCLQHPVLEFIGGVGMAIFLVVAGHLVLAGTMTAGDFFTQIACLFAAYDPIKRVGRINSTMQQGIAAATRVFEILDTEPEIADTPGVKALPPFRARISFDQVDFWYDDKTHALKSVSLVVPAGQTLAIVGHSGSGKTTFTNLIPRFLDVTGGSISIDGVDIRDVSMHSLRSQIAIVTQQTILFNETVRNNIAYGSMEAGDEAVAAAAEAAHALSFITALPDGFNTVIGEGGARLSGGERQRISIARAILKNAPILILDEATSSLDTESEREVQSALENLMKNRTTFVIAHRLSTIKNADRIIVMKQGSIVEEGTHDVLIEKKGDYEALYSMQYR